MVNRYVFKGVLFLAAAVTFALLAGCPAVNPVSTSALVKALLGDGCRGCGPLEPTLAINGGAVYTDNQVVTLDNSGMDNPVEYLASESPDFEGAVWKPWSDAPSFPFNGSAIARTIYFKTRNANGESETLTDSIYLAPRMVAVDGGAFTMGRSYSWEPQWNSEPMDETPAHEVTLEAYRIGKFEVTNQQFCDVLNWARAQGLLFSDAAGTAWAGSGDMYAGGPGAQHRIAAFSSVECDIVFDADVFVPKERPGLPQGTQYSMAEFPVANVTWYGAAAFCNWLSQMFKLSPCYDMSVEDWDLISPLPDAAGYRLPTEAEWERAAAWEPDGKARTGVLKSASGKHWIFGFSWDSSLSPNRCNYQRMENYEYVNPMGLETTPGTSPVGWFNGENKSPNGNVQTQLSRSPAGAYDMSGNVWEWCNDWYAEAFYNDGAMDNPLGPASGTGRVNRGGAWNTQEYRCRSAERNYSLPVHASSTIGLRLVLPQ